MNTQQYINEIKRSCGEQMKKNLSGTESELQDRLEEIQRENDALKARLADYSLLIEAEPDAIFVIDDQSGEILSANTAATTLYGYSRDELLGMRNLDLSADPEPPPKVVRQDPVSGIQTVTIPLRWHKKKDGKRFPVEITARFTVWEGRSVYVAAIRDIGPRLELEEEKERILNLSREFICIAGMDGYFKYLNPVWEEVLGYSRQEMMARPFLDFIHPDDHMINNQEVARLAANQLTFDFVNRYIAKNGRVITVSWVATPLVGQGLMLCMGRDISLRRKAEEDLIARNSLLSALINSSKDMVILAVDTRNNYTVFNELHRSEMKRLLGVDIEIGKNFLQYISFPQLRETTRQGIDRALAGESFTEAQYHPDLDTHYEVSWTPIVQNGQITGVMVIAKDISEQRQLTIRLQEQLALLRIAGEMARLGGWVIDLDRKQVKWSDETAAIHEMPTGYSPSLEGRLEFYTPEWRDRVSKVFSACARDGTPYDEELEIVTASGKRAWVRSIGEAVRDSSGRIVKVQGALQDISERKKDEQALERMAQDWKTTFDASGDAIVILDEQNRILRVNQSAVLFFKKNESDMIGRPCWMIVHNSSEPIQECPTVKVRDSLKRDSTVLAMGGSWYEITVDPLTDANGRYRGAVHVIRDITMRKWAEEELIRGQNRLKSLNNILQYQTDSIQKLLDYSLEEAIRITGSRIGYIYYYSEKTQEFTLNSWSKEVMAECRVTNPETLYHLDKTGIWGEAVRQRRPIVINEYEQADPLKKGYPQGHVHLKRFLTVPIFQNDRIVATVGMANKEQPYEDADVLQLSLLMGAVWEQVERKRTVDENRRLEEQFRQVQKLESIGRLAGGVAHDFNNMLCIILGYGEALVRSMPEQSRARQDALEIVDAAKRSAALTRQLLAFSRRQTLQPVVLDINQLLLGMEKMLRRLIGEDIILQMHLEENLFPTLADPGQIEQVMMNLVVNARDAMPDGGNLTIDTNSVVLDQEFAQNHSGVTPGHYIQINVSDNGCGMAPEVIAQIFEPFYTTKELGKGTGLGLSTVYGIVKQSGGNVWAYSEPGKGTTFKVYLPASGRFPKFDEDEVLPVRPRGTGQMVLVVDDEKSLLQLTERTLSDLGYRVTSFSSAQEALSMVQSGMVRPDLLISDVIMPMTTGPELKDRIQKVLPDLKTLFMSGYTDRIVLDRDGQVSGTTFLQKPFNTHDLATKVEALLKK